MLETRDGDVIVRAARLRRLCAGAFIIAIGLGAAGCMAGRSEFSRPLLARTHSAAQPASQPIVLNSATAGDQADPGPAPGLSVAATADPQPAQEPMALSEPQPLQSAAAAGGGPSSSAPKSKDLSPQEKARLIAELEALAKSQDATSAAGAPAKCTDEAGTPLDPEQRLNGDFGAGQC